MKKKEVPQFRFEALEEKFIEHMTRISEIFRDYGTLKDYFNIKQMLHVLKTP
jgi:histone deacetylase complex regulatory component SIN3